MIGVFDSGIGGLTVVRALRKLDPKLDILYLGDTARTPYGTKSPETIQRYALEDAEYLVRAGAKILVVACNTASAVAVDALQKKFPNIPLFEVITPAVKAALQQASRGRIGVIGTRATINSGIYERLIQNPPPNLPLAKQEGGKNQNNFLPLKPGGGLKVGVQVLSRACPLFVPLVEEGWTQKSETKRIAKHYLQKFKANNADAVILGCTHYPFLREIIQRAVGRHVRLIDPAEECAREVINFLAARDDLQKQCRNEGGLEIHLTDLTPHFSVLAQKWLGLPQLKIRRVSL